MTTSQAIIRFKNMKVLNRRQNNRKYRQSSIEEEQREINNARKAIGLPVIKFADRKCLGCNTLFNAQLNSNNFFCPECRSRLYGSESWEF